MPDNNHFHQIFHHLARAASSAVDGVSSTVQKAGSVVKNSYSGVKTRLELGHLRDEQQRLFSDMGRLVFVLEGGAANNHAAKEARESLAQLQAAAAQLQQEIDRLSERLQHLWGGATCPACGSACHSGHSFCHACGARLPQQPKTAAGTNGEGPSTEADTKAGSHPEETAGPSPAVGDAGDAGAPSSAGTAKTATVKRAAAKATASKSASAKAGAKPATKSTAAKAAKGKATGRRPATKAPDDTDK